jgi:hypothetical protein
MLFQLETGMDVNRIVIFMIERQCVEELQMLRRNGVLNIPASVIEILLAGYVKNSAYILLKRAFAAGYRSNPKVGAPFHEIQQHLFMVAPEAKHAVRIFVLKFHYKGHTARRVRASID